MLRGAQKHMIVIRTRDSRVFEEAYFVIRRDADRAAADESDMLWEANRILETAAPRPRGETPLREEEGRGLLRGLVWFLIGLITGGGGIGLLWLILG